MTARVKILSSLGAALALGAIALGGVVLAQTGGGSTGASAATPAPNAAQPNGHAPGGGRSGITRDQYLNDLAKNLGIDRAKLDAGLKQTSLQEVDADLAAGRITADQANTRKQAINSGTAPFGPLGPGGPRGGDHGAADGTGAVVMTCLQGAQSAVNTARGQAQPAAGAAVAAAVKPCLDQAVKDGKLTADQETKILAEFTSGKGPFGVGGSGGAGRPGPGRRGVAATPTTN